MATCEKIRGIDYEKANSTPILNLRGMAPKLRQWYNTSDITHLLHKNNVQDFKTLWGEQSCTWNGEYRFWIWLHRFPSCHLFVLSAPGAGTTYEAVITGDEPKATAEISSFLSILIDELQYANPNF